MIVTVPPQPGPPGSEGLEGPAVALRPGPGPTDSVSSGPGPGGFQRAKAIFRTCVQYGILPCLLSMKVPSSPTLLRCPLLPTLTICFLLRPLLPPLMLLLLPSLLCSFLVAPCNFGKILLIQVCRLTGWKRKRTSLAYPHHHHAEGKESF